MERDKKIDSEYRTDLFERVQQQIVLAKTIIAKSKQVVAQSKQQTRQHAIEIESYMEAIRINK